MIIENSFDMLCISFGSIYVKHIKNYWKISIKLNYYMYSNMIKYTLSKRFRLELNTN